MDKRVADLEALVATLQAQLAANTAADAAAHHARYTDAEAIAAVGANSPDFSALLMGVERLEDPNTGQDTLRFQGMNVQIVNGSGSTTNNDGTGNLIIGYNEPRASDSGCPDGFDCNRRGGSHNLLIGDSNNYTSYGGMVVGEENESSGPFASVSGGSQNKASGWWSSVTGGFRNTASGPVSSVTGGGTNTADGLVSSVSGGDQNIASGTWSSVSGGQSKTAGSGACTVADNYTDC